MPEVQASRAHTLDGILDELPDFSDGYFSYPVDDFFPQYVEKLGQGGAQEPAQNGGSGGLMQFSDIYPSNGTHPSPSSAQPIRTGSQLPTVMSLDLEAFDMAEPAVFLPHNDGHTASNPTGYPSTMMQMPLIGTIPQQNSNDNMHSEGSGSMAGSGDFNHRTSNRGRTQRSKVNSDYNLDSGDDSEEAEQIRRGTRAPGKAKRNAKQQAQNKQAQQRYRERRKQRFNDMEHAIDELNARLQQMQTIKTQNAVLMARSNELTSMIEAKDAEIDRLRGQVQDDSVSPRAEQSYEQRRQAEEALLSDMQGQAAKNVMEMKEFINKYRIRDVQPTGEGVDPQVLQQIAGMVGRQCGANQSSQRPDGVKLLRLMSADMGQLSRIRCIRKRESLSIGVQNLKLSDVQKQQLLMLRTNHLNNLKDIYVERQQLNMQAMAFMLPNGGNQGAENTLENKLQRMRHASFRRMAAQAVGLDEILSSIKENLRKEQKRVMEMNFVTLHRILSPIQAAIYVVDIFPMSFDALELTNYLFSESSQNSAERQLFNEQSTENHTDANSSFTHEANGNGVQASCEG